MTTILVQKLCSQVLGGSCRALQITLRNNHEVVAVAIARSWQAAYEYIRRCTNASPASYEAALRFVEDRFDLEGLPGGWPNDGRVEVFTSNNMHELEGYLLQLSQSDLHRPSGRPPPDSSPND